MFYPVSSPPHPCIDQPTLPFATRHSAAPCQGSLSSPVARLRSPPFKWLFQTLPRCPMCGNRAIVASFEPYLLSSPVGRLPMHRHWYLAQTSPLFRNIAPPWSTPRDTCSKTPGDGPRNFLPLMPNPSLDHNKKA